MVCFPLQTVCYQKHECLFISLKGKPSIDDLPLEQMNRVITAGYVTYRVVKKQGAMSLYFFSLEASNLQKKNRAALFLARDHTAHYLNFLPRGDGINLNFNSHLIHPCLVSKWCVLGALCWPHNKLRRQRDDYLVQKSHFSIGGILLSAEITNVLVR